MYDINTMPINLTEWNTLIAHYTAEAQAKYDAELAEAEAAFDAAVPARREEMIAKLNAYLDAQTVDTEEGPQPMPQAARQAQYDTGVMEIDKQLASEREQAISMVEPLKGQEYWEEYFKAAGYYPQEQPDMPMSAAPTEADLFAWLRAERDRRLVEYDEKISQLERRARIGENVASQIAAWDAYAIALCDLPQQPGAPWDGGSSNTPWPVRP